MRIIYREYNAADILKVTEKEPLVGGLSFCRYVFSSKASQNSEFGGAGLYACFYRKKLIYIGKYQGDRGNFRFGNVITMRWAKHLGTFTMQARDLGFSKKALTEILEAVACNGTSQGKVPQVIADGFLAANQQVLQRETGCMTTFQRFLVSIDVWSNAARPGDVPDLSDFHFVYARIDGDIQTEEARKIVSSAEKYSLERAHPRGNSIYNRTLTSAPISSEIQSFFEEALMASASKKFLKSETYDDILDASEVQVGDIEPEENMTRFEVLNEEAPIFSQKFVEEIKAHFNDVEGADIEFTNTPDMRVRKLYPHTARGFRNCLRFEWQPTKRRFLMYSQLSDSTLQSFGLDADRIRKSDVLFNVTFLSEQKLLENMSTVVEAISHAVNIFEP
jgi:hypothetical protein